MMMVLRDFLERQKANIDKIPEDAKLMIINKSDLAVVAVLNKATIPEYDIADEFLSKGIESYSQNKSLGCAIITITEIPNGSRQMFV